MTQAEKMLENPLENIYRVYMFLRQGDEEKEESIGDCYAACLQIKNERRQAKGQIAMLSTF